MYIGNVCDKTGGGIDNHVSKSGEIGRLIVEERIFIIDGKLGAAIGVMAGGEGSIGDEGLAKWDVPYKINGIECTGRKAGIAMVKQFKMKAVDVVDIGFVALFGT